MSYSKHESVLKNECLNYLTYRDNREAFPDTPISLFADLTFGGGGHSFSILEEDESFQVVATDQDPDALKNGYQKIKERGFEERLNLLSMNFESFFTEVQNQELFVRAGGLKGIIIDLGVSSHHFDSPERGFSYRFDSPLDMRMNPQDEIKTAADLVNTLSEDELAEIFKDYGEEKLAMRIATQICEKRKEVAIERTGQLEDIIFHCYPKKWRYGKTNPSTRVFQALRIAVNRELDVLTKTIAQVPQLLLPGGRLCVISFHSLEDRIVKNQFKQAARNQIEMVGEYKILTKKPVIPGQEEIEVNSRSRSAKLRVLERLS